MPVKLRQAGNLVCVRLAMTWPIPKHSSHPRSGFSTAASHLDRDPTACLAGWALNNNNACTCSG